MQKRALKISLYVACAGAFSVFLRWLQDQLAFNELGLADKSVFHAMVLVFLLAVALVFRHFLDQMKQEQLYLPEDFHEALHNEGRIYQLCRWGAGGVMAVGALLLFASCETDRHPGMLRALAAVGFFSGLAYPLLLGEANKKHSDPWKISGLAVLPVLLYAVWLVVSYRENTVNSVIWAYALDIFTPIAAMAAFYRLAGFAFGSPDGRRSLFTAMFGAVMCMMALADERYMGMQLMLVASAGMLVLCVWIMVANLQKGKPREKKTVPDDGFERL